MLGVAGFRTDLSHAFVHARDLPDGVKSLARINFATFKQILIFFFPCKSVRFHQILLCKI